MNKNEFRNKSAKRFAKGEAITSEKLEEFASDITDIDFINGSPSIVTYELTQTNAVTNHNGAANVDRERRTMTYDPVTRLGIIHLDYQRKSNAKVQDVGFNLPSDAPTPVGFVEYQGANGNAFMYQNKRQVIVSGEQGKRNILNIVAFFSN